jgi:membrane protease YdiL (CAAX protease family)
VACAVTVASGVLRTFHHSTPRLPWPPGPFSSLLFAAVALLVALHIVQRGAGRDLLQRRRGLRGLTVAQVVPLLLVALGEKWISGELLHGLFDDIDARIADADLADAVYRLTTGLGLLAAALVLAPAVRQARPRRRRYLNAPRAREAAALAGAAVILTGAAAVFLKLVTRGSWSVALPPAPVAAIAAQVVRGSAEELFFRGLLQTTLIWLLVQAGLPDRRPPRILAVLVVSAAFSLEHIDPTAPRAVAAGGLAYVFLMSVVLGILLEVSRNLYLPMAAHTTVNLLLVGAAPLPVSSAGVLLLTPFGAGLVFMVLLFAALATEHEWMRWRRRVAGAA